MGAMRDSLEVSLGAAIELDVVEPDKHAALIAAARVCADEIDAGELKASLLTAFLSYCKALGIAPSQQQRVQVVGTGRVAKMRAHSVARRAG